MIFSIVNNTKNPVPYDFGMSTLSWAGVLLCFIKVRLGNPMIITRPASEDNAVRLKPVLRMRKTYRHTF